MADYLLETIAHLQKKLRQEEDQVAQTKKTINSLCAEAGQPPMFAETEASGGSVFAIRSDLFYGRPLATGIKEYLTLRKASNLGAASVREIYDALVRGGYKFETTNEDNARRTLQISLSKNQAFHRIPTGAWGLREWYPNAKIEKPANDAIEDEDGSESAVTEKKGTSQKGGKPNENKG